MSRAVLVTGGAGFIGSHIVDALVADGHDVRVLDKVLNGDVTDVDTVSRAIEGVDAVCHQAAMVGLGTNFAEVTDYVHHNDVGTAVLLHALATTSFAGRLVLASSMVVYGEGRYRCAEHGAVRAGPRAAMDLARGRFDPPCPVCGGSLLAEPVTEAARVDPRNVYAATKLHQEQLCMLFGREQGVPVAALRYHNVYGPRMPRNTPYAGVASIFLSALERGRAPEVFEDGGQLRDFVHVTDVARANVLALTAEVPIDGILNVASGEPHSVGEMAEMMWGSYRSAAPRPVVTGDFRLGDVRHVFASADRAYNVLGFKAQVSFAAGMTALARKALP